MNLVIRQASSVRSLVRWTRFESPWSVICPLATIRSFKQPQPSEMFQVLVADLTSGKEDVPNSRNRSSGDKSSAFKAVRSRLDRLGMLE